MKVRAFRYLFYMLFATSMLAPPAIYAQDILMPKVGRQYGVVGIGLQPGIIVDEMSSQAISGHAIFSLHHLLSYHFMMSGEIQLGVSWLDDHRASPTPPAQSEVAFSWQAGLIARWLPWTEGVGWSLGLGSHYFRASLADAALQIVAFEPRIGRYIWQGDDAFWLFELGYSFPFIQGLSIPTDYSEDAPQPAPQNWFYHRATISIQYGW